MKNRLWANIIKWCLPVLLCFVMAEITLRVQQRLGPLYDLEFKDLRLDLSFQSEIYNHVPIEWGDVKHDSDGIMIPLYRPYKSKGGAGIKVLFMGDSFTEAPDQRNNFPQVAWEKASRRFSIPLYFMNAGCSSYSPSIYIVQAKHLLPVTKPDYVVIAIDETDLCDEAFRYRHLIVRDSNQKIIAVRPTPHYKIFNEGFIQIRTSPLYVVRMIRKLYHTKVRMPPLNKLYGTDIAQCAIQSDPSPRAKEIHAEDIAVFENNLLELAETVIAGMGSPSKVLFLHHPHLQQLKPDSKGFLWHPFVPEALSNLSQKTGVRYYDLTQDMKVAFGGQPEKYYLPGDMHFNAEGFRIYGELVAQRFFRLLLQ
jgi:hypothetical protein